MSNRIISTLGIERHSEDHAETIIVGVDGSTESHRALKEGARLAELFGCKLEAVTVWQYPAEIVGVGTMMWYPKDDAEKIAETAARLVFGRQWPEWFTACVTEGDPAEVLIGQSANTRMLIVGSRGRGGFARLLLGSVSAECAAHASCAVLIMHPDHAAQRQLNPERTELAHVRA